MKQDIETKLWTLARACPPSEQVPYAFEKRVMAALRARGAQDPISVWASLLWRSVAPCLALTFLLGFYAVQIPGEAPAPAPPSSTQVSSASEINLEDTLLAPIREEVSLAIAW